jgi:hypothetical protein
LGAASEVVLVRAIRAGVLVDREGLTVRNPLRTHRIPWDEVERFAAEPDWWHNRIGYVERRDGRRIRMWGVRDTTGALRSRPEVVDRLVLVLTADLEEARADASGLRN